MFRINRELMYTICTHYQIGYWCKFNVFSFKKNDEFQLKKWKSRTNATTCLAHIKKLMMKLNSIMLRSIELVKPMKNRTPSRYLPQSMQMNRYLNRCSCSTMYSHWTIYFHHFYRWSWAFERHQLFLSLDVTMIRYVYEPTSTQPVLNRSFFCLFFTTLFQIRFRWNVLYKNWTIHAITRPDE